MKRILVTGASGFVGSHALDSLVQRGYDAHAVSSKPDCSSLHDVRWHIADLLQGADVRSLMEAISPTCLLHLAWYTKPVDYWRSMENYRWLDASIDLIRTFFEHGGKRVVVAGTCAEYDWHEGVCSEATTPCRPMSIYGKCKLALQQALQQMPREGGRSAAWARFFFLYGPREHPNRLLPSVILSLLNCGKASCLHGNLLRDYLYIEDAGEALAALVDSTVQGPVNIGSGIPVALKELVGTAAEQLCMPGHVEIGTDEPECGDPPLLLADVHRLRNEVGFVPKFRLKAGIAETVEWWETRYQPRDLHSTCDVGRLVF